MGTVVGKQGSTGKAVPMKLDKGVDVSFGKVSGVLYGGPYWKFIPGTRRLIGVKMAVEVNHPCDVDIPTDDFSVPDVNDMQRGLQAAIAGLYSGKDIYAGCMGGIGRTGLFMGCMVKTMFDYGNVGPHFDPVTYVRNSYNSHAIETQQQQDFVRAFNTAPVLEFIRTVLEAVPEPVLLPREVAPVYPGLWHYLVWWLGGGFLEKGR